MSLVEVSHLSRRFGSVTAVEDLSLAFDAGEIYGFIGPNGAGKSTTMRILATLDLPSEGDCRIAGLSTVDDADAVRRMIGYMPDSYGTYPNMTVLDYLDFFARAYALRDAARLRAVADVVDFCQLGGLADKPITTLSKGMKQRLCLGRCLIHDPKLLILDEPSAGLDPRARIEFRELLRLLAQQGKAILISSHILAELEELCDGVAIIEQGRMVRSGPMRDLRAQLERQSSAATVDGVAVSAIEIRLAAPFARAAEVLAEQAELDEVRIDGTHLTARFRGGVPEQAELLKRLIAAGMPIHHFSRSEEGLESLFMRLTEGKVQ